MWAKQPWRHWLHESSTIPQQKLRPCFSNRRTLTDKNPRSMHGHTFALVHRPLSLHGAMIGCKPDSMFSRLHPRIVWYIGYCQDTTQDLGIKDQVRATFLCGHHWASIHQQVDPIGIPQQFHSESTGTAGFMVMCLRVFILLTTSPLQYSCNSSILHTSWDTEHRLLRSSVPTKFRWLSDTCFFYHRHRIYILVLH